MKEKYFRELGLEPGASEKEIKRAYFKLVRQFSPEKDPEKFRQIREAYESLQEISEEDGPSFAEPSDPIAKKMLETIWNYQKAGDLEMCKRACEEAHRYFPDEIVFLYMMVQAQRRAGNTGKAVKNAELLVKKDADNKWFWKELAVSYSERGYNKKAFGAFEKAYRLGCRDNDFVLMYSTFCNDYEEFETGIRILSELLSSNQKWTGENFPEALEAFTGIIAMNIRICGNFAVEAMDKMLAIVHSNPVLINDSVREMAMILFMMITASEALSEEETKRITELLFLLDRKKSSPEVTDLITQCRRELVLGKIERDERLCDTLKAGANVFLFMEEDEKLKRYGMTDIKLCMLKEKQEILSQIDIIEKEYPEYFKLIEDFIQKLRIDDDAEYLKSRLLKEYVRMDSECSGGIYFEKYPEEKARSLGTVVYDGDQETPYVRANKKIGRNDPCPCGSGRKYKQCCGRK